MKRYMFFLILHFVTGPQDVEAGRIVLIDTVTLQKSTLYPQDSVYKQGQTDENPPATFSIVSSAISVGLVALGIPIQNIAFLVVAGIFGLIAFVTSIAGLRRRNKLMKGKYSSFPNSKKLSLGQGRSIAGLIIGSIISFFFVVFLILAATYTFTIGGF